MPTSRLTVVPVLLVVALAGSLHAAPDACRARASALGDAKAIAAVRGAIARQCPCASFDGSSKAKGHSRFVKCANAVIDDAADGTPLLGTFTLRRQCRSEVRNIYATAACGDAAPRVMCCAAKPTSGIATKSAYVGWTNARLVPAGGWKPARVSSRPEVHLPRLSLIGLIARSPLPSR